MAWFRRTPKLEQRSALVSIGDPAIAAMLGYTPADGVTVSESTALTLSAVFRAVSLISGAIGSLPLRTLEVQSNGQKVEAASFLDNPGGERYTPFEWKQLVTVHLLMHGNCYLQHIRNGAGALVALNPIHPLAVTPYWDDAAPGGKVFEVQVEENHGPGSAKTRTVFLDGSQMTQIMGLSLDGLRGLSPIAAARLSLGTGLAGDKAAQRNFTNGALISGMVTPDGDEDFTEPEAKVIKESINRKMLGTENAGDIPVFNRRLKFSPWTMTAADAQFIESRTFSIDEVGRWFGVPPHLLGLTEKSTSWGQGIAEQNRGLARYTLTSWTRPIEQRCGRLLSGPKRTAEFDYTAFVEPSPEDKINLLIQQVNSGLLTLNEARQIMNLPAVAGGDLPRLPAGAIPPEQVANPEPPADAGTPSRPEVTA